METLSCSVSKCKLASGGGAGPHQSGHRTGAILWSGKNRQEVLKECSVLSVNHNFSLLWVHILEPGVYDIVSWCQHIVTKWCLPTNHQQLQNYVLCCQARECPPTTVYQATSRVLPCLHMSTNQCLPGNAPSVSIPAYVFQPMNIKQHPEVTRPKWSFGMSACTHQTTYTKQSLPSDARTCWINLFSEANINRWTQRKLSGMIIFRLKLSKKTFLWLLLF